MCSPNFADFSAPNAKHSPMLQRQLIIPHFAFPCAAIVTQWEALVHMKGRRPRRTRVEFQVWRLDEEQGEYHLVGNNSNIVGRQSIKMQGDRIVMEIENPMYQIHVKPRDIVGLFIQGDRIEMKFTSSDTLHTYIANLDSPLMLESFDEHDRIFRKPFFKGTPMIRASTGT